MNNSNKSVGQNKELLALLETEKGNEMNTMNIKNEQNIGMNNESPNLEGPFRGEEVDQPHQPQQQQQSLHSNTDKQQQIAPKISDKPIYSYPCLIGLSLKNSPNGQLTSPEIYKFICHHFPHFRETPTKWKKAIWQCLTYGRYFTKTEIEASPNKYRKSYIFTMNPAQLAKMDEKLKKWREKNEMRILNAMENPDDLDSLQNGMMGMPQYRREISNEDEEANNINDKNSQPQLPAKQLRSSYDGGSLSKRADVPHFLAPQFEQSCSSSSNRSLNLPAHNLDLDIIEVKVENPGRSRELMRPKSIGELNFGALLRQRTLIFEDIKTADGGTIGKITVFVCNQCRGEYGIVQCTIRRAYCIKCCGHPECD